MITAVEFSMSWSPCIYLAYSISVNFYTIIIYRRHWKWFLSAHRQASH